MYEYDDMKSSRFSVTSDLVSGCFNVGIGRFMLRESESNAVYRAWPDLGFLTNQRAWTSREPIRGYKRVSGRGIGELIHDQGSRLELRSREAKSQSVKCHTCYSGE